MLKNYLKIAFRNLVKRKINSAINIMGLAVGIASCVLLMLYIQNEWSYDEFHDQSDNIYRAWVHEDYGDGEIYFNTVTPLILSETLQENIPEVKEATRFTNFVNLVKRPNQKTAFSESVSVVDPTFFGIFDFELLRGNPESVLDNPDKVVITRRMADKYFEVEDPTGKILSIRIGDTYEDYTVSGIVGNPPVNSSLQFDFLISFSNSPIIFSNSAQTSWFSVATETYVLLNEQSDPDNLQESLSAMMHSVLGEQYGDEYREGDLSYTVGLQPITDIHLNTDMPQGIAAVSDPTYTYILGAVALLVLLIACVNFMTLSISRSVFRAKEVGIRKTIGAHRRHLMIQFWGEALLITILSFCAGIVLAELLIPQFNVLTGKELQLIIGPQILFVLAAASVFISLVAGIYPALILSGFKPAEVLKGRLNLSADKNLFRQTMVVLQFTLSIILISGTILVNKQLDFLRSTDLGYQKEQVVVLETDLTAGPNKPFREILEQAEKIKERLVSKWNRVDGIEKVSMSAFTPVQPGGWINADFKEPNGRKRVFNFNIVDHEFLDTYGIDIVAGRGFANENPSDERRAIMVNKALVEDYGWENPIGRRLPGPDFEGHEIIGVVENFHYQSLHVEVKPLVLTINPVIVFSGIENVGFAGSPKPRFSLQLKTDELPETMNLIESAWSEIAGGMPFNYTFVDQAVDNQYRQEERLSRIVIFGSALAILIACMGLFGLASLMTVRRTKEIGIRKVLGASIQHIIMLVNKEFTRLIIIAFFIALPIAWYAIDIWLQNFAYRVDFGILVFIWSGIIALGIAWFSIGYQTLKAAFINPVESLRSE